MSYLLQQKCEANLVNGKNEHKNQLNLYNKIYKYTEF